MLTQSFTLYEPFSEFPYYRIHEKLKKKQKFLDLRDSSLQVCVLEHRKKNFERNSSCNSTACLPALAATAAAAAATVIAANILLRKYTGFCKLTLRGPSSLECGDALFILLLSLVFAGLNSATSCKLQAQPTEFCRCRSERRLGVGGGLGCARTSTPFGLASLCHFPSLFAEPARQFPSLFPS